MGIDAFFERVIAIHESSLASLALSAEIDQAAIMYLENSKKLRAVKNSTNFLLRGVSVTCARSLPKQLVLLG
jgi:hypothetical protein